MLLCLPLPPPDPSTSSRLPETLARGLSPALRGGREGPAAYSARVSASPAAGRPQPGGPGRRRPGWYAAGRARRGSRTSAGFLVPWGPASAEHPCNQPRWGPGGTGRWAWGRGMQRALLPARGRLDCRHAALLVASTLAGHAEWLWPRALWVLEGFPEQRSPEPHTCPLLLPPPGATRPRFRRKRRVAAYPDLPVQGRDDLAHHPHQVLVLVGVVCEPHGLPDRQDLFADEPGVSTRGLSSRPSAGFRLQ